MEIIGKSPIAVPVLILGKIAMLGCWLFFVVKKLSADAMLYDSAVTQAIGVAVSVAGLFVVVLSLLHLGGSASVGIPEQKTELKTHGMYRISRNPVYVGGFLMCAGSCLFSIHLLNFLLFAITIAVHHMIVTKEEQFLEKTFGQQWLDLKERVPRYVGRIRSPNTVRNSA